MANKLEIRYCTQAHTLARASWIGQELLSILSQEISELSIQPRANGVFEVAFDGELIWSLEEQDRFPEILELVEHIRNELGEQVHAINPRKFQENQDNQLDHPEDGIEGVDDNDGSAAKLSDVPPELKELAVMSGAFAPPEVNEMQLDMAISLLQKNLGGDEQIDKFIAALKTLQSNPVDQSSIDSVYQAFKDLGPSQGAVLTYAPYIGILVVEDDPFAD